MGGKLDTKPLFWFLVGRPPQQQTYVGNSEKRKDKINEMLENGTDFNSWPYDRFVRDGLLLNDAAGAAAMAAYLGCFGDYMKTMRYKAYDFKTKKDVYKYDVRKFEWEKDVAKWSKDQHEYNWWGKCFFGVPILESM